MSPALPKGNDNEAIVPVFRCCANVYLVEELQEHLTEGYLEETGTPLMVACHDIWALLPQQKGNTMKSLSYDSAMMQFLSKVGDIVLLNLLFVLCSVPVVTLGAAQAGLFTAMKVFRDKEDDSSCFKAFFRGFTSGFWKITGLWCVFLVLAVLPMKNLIVTMFYQYADPDVPVGMSIAALCMIYLFEVLVIQFHSRFNCSAWILLRNSGLFLLAYPVHSVLASALTWLPLALILLNTHLFAELTLFFLLAYFSLAYWLILRITDKPFMKIMVSLNS